VSSALRRVSTGAAAWTVGAVASVAVSMLALTVIGGVGGDVQPPAPMPAMDGGLSADAGGDSASPSPSGTATPSPSGMAGARPGSPTAPASSAPTVASPTPGPPRQLNTSGGVVTAQCIGQLAYLVSWSPAPGYRVEDVRRGPAVEALVTFVMFSTHQENELAVRCVAGVPRLVHADH
jgi:hypothetical protein